MAEPASTLPPDVILVVGEQVVQAARDFSEALSETTQYQAWEQQVRNNGRNWNDFGQSTWVCRPSLHTCKPNKTCAYCCRKSTMRSASYFEWILLRWRERLDAADECPGHCANCLMREMLNDRLARHARLAGEM